MSLPSSFDFPTCLFCQRHGHITLFCSLFVLFLLTHSFFGSFLKTHSVCFCSSHYHFSHVVKKKSLFTAFHLSVDRNISIFCWSSFKLFWPHFLFLCLSLSVCVAQPDPAAHSSCMDHKPQQRNKLRLQGWRGEREHQLQVLDLALYLHLHHPWRRFTVHYGWGTKWQQSRNAYFNSHRWCSNDLLAGGVERWVLCDEIQESECVKQQGRKVTAHLITFWYQQCDRVLCILKNLVCESRAVKGRSCSLSRDQTYY